MGPLIHRIWFYECILVQQCRLGAACEQQLVALWKTLPKMFPVLVTDYFYVRITPFFKINRVLFSFQRPGNFIYVKGNEFISITKIYLKNIWQHKIVTWQQHTKTKIYSFDTS